ncbi:hypothetical protein OAN61_00650 [bacterium]|nr:hypothetical protein [bacterium]
MHSKLDEIGASHVHRGNQQPFVALPYSVADTASIEACYRTDFGFVKDGMLFLCKEGHYAAGTTPLSLLWKDNASSEYFIETRSKGDEQICTCILGPAAELLTCDDPPMVLGALPEDLVTQQTPPLVPGDPVRCAVLGVHVDDATGTAAGAALEFRGHGGKARAGADSWSKLLFQYSARHTPLVIEEVLAAAAASEGTAQSADDTVSTGEVVAYGSGYDRVGVVGMGSEGCCASSEWAATEPVGSAGGSGARVAGMVAGDSDDEL